MSLLQRSGRSFRAEKVPLCYMTDFAWASTETRKIVKGEERVVHFLDDKQTVRQTDWDHLYAEACTVCSLRTICGGLFERGNGYDPAELHPVFVDRAPIVERIIQDPEDPSYAFRSLQDWEVDFERRLTEARAEHRPRLSDDRQSHQPPRDEDAPTVGFTTNKSLKQHEARQRSEDRRMKAVDEPLENG